MKNISDHLIIAIDGYSSTGKSSFAKNIATALEILYVDSGAMYRAVTLWAIQNNGIKNGAPDEKRINSALDSLKIEFRKEDGSASSRLFLNGRDSEAMIRSMEVSNNVSPVSKIKEVRDKLVEQQRDMSDKGSIVMDGRDIGTVVFPRADIKIFMTADPEIRAERRYKELKEKGLNVKLSDVLKNINERDRIDQSRTISPLKKADDAIVLDNSFMTPDEQMNWFFNTFKEKLF